MNSKPKSQRSADGSAPSLRVRRPKSTRRKRLNRRSVLTMLKMMENTPDSPIDQVQDFLTTGRTGRRNAMPDILGEHASTSTGDLPDCLQKLNTLDESSSTARSEASTSGAGASSTTPETPTETPTTPPERDPPKDPDGTNS